jgi:tetratricopeptide (TPR) repeat protein
MGSGDWVALGSAIVATVALLVSGYTYRLQQKTESRTAEQELNDLIEKLQDGLASLNRPQGSIAFETYAVENAATLAGLYGHAIEAVKLLERSGIEPDWFQSMILAYAFTQAWDPAGAIDYWKRAVEVSKPEHQPPGHKKQYAAYIRSLTSRAEFYYNRGRKNGEGDDWQLARRDYETAVRELLRDPDGQGPDLAKQLATSILVYQAGLEFNMVGDDTKAITFIGEAFFLADSIIVPWRKLKALEYAVNYVSMLQHKVQPPRDLLKPVADELSRRKVEIDKFPASVQALWTLPPDGGLGTAPGQPTKLYGATS